MKRLNENGHVIIFVTLAFVILGFFIGLATDGGRGFLIRAELTRTVDAAAIAAASRINTGGLTAAEDAACDAASINGGIDCSNLVVTQVTVNDATGNPTDAVQVTGTASTPTIFTRLGKLIGCGAACDSINVTASAVAASGIGPIDLVMNLDDTRSISQAGWLSPLKTGAKALVDAMVPTTGASNAQVSMVPFRGCYDTINPRGLPGCENSNEYSLGTIVSLSTSNTTLKNGIDALTGLGSSGTNNCEGLTMARQKLFQSGKANPDAQKFMVVFSDAQSNYSMTALFTSCRASSSGSGSANDKINLLTYNVAQEIKNGTNVGTTGQLNGQTVKIFVIFYGSNGPAPAACTPPPAGATSWSTTPLNLGRCIASTSGDMYFAPTPSAVQAAFQQIINRLPVLLVN